MTSIAVRQSDVGDLDAVAGLFDQYRQFQGKPADLPAARDFLRDRYQRGESVIFLATIGSRPVGMAQLYPSFSSISLTRVFILNDLFVSEAGRRKGVASSVLLALEAYAWAQGASRVSLNVAMSNTNGQALYAASGWIRDAEFFMYPASLPHSQARARMPR